MNYHNIIHDDFLNNLDGIGVTLFVSGCDGHGHCKGCHNPQTWEYGSGIPFDEKAKEEIFDELRKSHVSTLTLTGGDPLSPLNVKECTSLAKEMKERFPGKYVWLYTGFLYEEVKGLEIMKYVDVLVDGPYVESERDETCLVKGSRNQKIYRLKDGRQRKVYIKTQENWDKEEMERKKAEESRKKVALTAKDIEWKPVYVNNMLCNRIEGIYGFLFKKQENGEIAGYKWTIVYQYEEIGHGRQEMDAPIEAYNLYFKEYHAVAGILGYREPGYTYLQCYEKSTIQDGIHSYGEFVRSYKTLELAKEAALFRNEWIGWGNVNLENILRVSLDERSIAEMEKDYMAKIEKKAHINIKTDITFGELRNYLSVLDRLSICMLETSSYNNYMCLKEVQHTYDDYYVYGVGMIESEFYKINKCEYAASGDRKDLALVNCIEVMLSEEPKSVLLKRYPEEEIFKKYRDFPQIYIKDIFQKYIPIVTEDDK